MASTDITPRDFAAPRGNMHYFTSGPTSGPLLIFIHGWPACGLTWKPQLQAFAAQGYFCVAPDLPGYGKTFAPAGDHSFYSLENLNQDMKALLTHLDRPKAVWIGHDWGVGLVWSFAAHFPDLCAGVVNMCLPYRTIELGFDELVRTVRRDMYPEDKYPYGQWGYQKHYLTNFDEATARFERSSRTFLDIGFRAADPATTDLSKPAFTALVHETGWFGGQDLPKGLDAGPGRLIDDETYEYLARGFEREGGWFGADAYYANHERNRAYCEDTGKLPNGGVLSMPVLYVDAQLDQICATEVTLDWERNMREFCRDLKRIGLEAGHWVALEKPEEVNGEIAGWLREKGLDKVAA